MSNFWRELKRPFTVLAPMEDVTDTVFRKIVARNGRPDVFFTEFTNADGICSRGRKAVVHRLRFSVEERPIVAQIWGNNPNHYVQASREIRTMGFDGIDINMGCPEKKIVKHGACSALIDNPNLAKELVLAAKEGAGPLPVSVKTRLGFKQKRTEEWSAFLLGLDLAALTMHGRTAKEMSDVPADWNEIAKVAQQRDQHGSSTLVIGNGDVASNSEVAGLAENHGVDGVMIGRGVFQNLFVFGPSSTPFESLSPEQKMAFYRMHVELFHEIWGAEKNMNILKKFAKMYISGFPGAAHVRAAFMDATSYEELLAATHPGQILPTA